jgi:hypothetical protein
MMMLPRETNQSTRSPQMSGIKEGEDGSVLLDVHFSFQDSKEQIVMSCQIRGRKGKLFPKEIIVWQEREREREREEKTQLLRVSCLDLSYKEHHTWIIKSARLLH